ncbi:GAF domain-containing protein [Patescibacteria group bacterium]|nr:GAF domain-containing protein [Patescibacteria group bacterium]
MDLIQVLPLLSAIFVLGLGFFILLKNIKSKLNIVFFFLSLTVTIWLIGTYKLFIGLTEPEIIFWDKFVYIGICMMPALFYHFSVLFTKNKKSRQSILLTYIVGIFFVIMLKTEYFVADVFYYDWGAHTKAQLFHHLFLGYYAIFIVLLFKDLYKYFNKTKSGLARAQSRYVLLAFLIFVIFGITGFLPAYSITVYPIAYIGGLLFLSLLAYAIVRHRFMDHRLIIQRGLINVLSLLVAIGLSKFIFNIFSWNFPRIDNWEILGLIVGLLTIQPLRNLFSGIANRYFFTDMYDYQSVLRDLSHHLTSIIDLEDIVDSIINTVNDSFSLENSGLIICSDNNGQPHCDVMMAYGASVGEIETIVHNKHLLKYLALSRAPLLADEIPIISKSILDTSTVDSLKKAHIAMNKSNIAMLAPLVKEDSLIGIIALGSKLSKETYSSEDLELIDILANQASVAIDNAQLYEQVKQFNTKLKKKVKEATTDLQKSNKKLTYANDNLQQLDRAKSEFLSIASHQLRTPLSGIKGYLSMLSEGDFGRLPKDAQIVISDLFANADRMSRLINTFLNISRIEANRLVIAKKQVDIIELVRSTARDFDMAAKKKKLKYTYSLPKKKIIVAADGDKIRDVVGNFIDNSLKYTSKGFVKLSIETTSKQVRIFIEDSGMGVSKKDLDKLFEKFARGTDITKVDTNGSGLGLYIAKKIIEAHDGVTFVSSPGKGKGSKFGFSLPLPAKKKKPTKKK